MYCKTKKNLISIKIYPLSFYLNFINRLRAKNNNLAEVDKQKLVFTVSCYRHSKNCCTITD